MIVTEDDIFKALSKIQPDDLYSLLDIVKRKAKHIKNQEYTQASDLRSKEKEILKKYDIFDYITSDTIIRVIRNIKINSIL